MSRFFFRKKVFLLGLVVFVDQLSKQLVIASGYRVVLNKGIAFGLLPSEVWVILVVVILWFGFRNTKEVGWWLMLSGGVSNLIDRIFRGGIVDFIFLSVIPVFNLADVAIVAGAAGLVLVQLQHEDTKDSFRKQRSIGDR